MMHIVHYKMTPCAYAPDAISQAINYYTPHTSEVVTDHRLLATTKADLIHFHNRFWPTDTPCLIQYHSEPHRADLENAPAYRLVLAQYQATLPEYATCHHVRNLVLAEHEPYLRIPEVKGVRIGYSPSYRGSDGWFDKGYAKTKEILHRVSESVGCTYDLIQNVPLDVCLERKSRCNILIDECQTGSYHRCTLEALALGRLAICHLNAEIDRIAREIAGAPLPVVNVPIDRLEETLVQVAEHPERIAECGRQSRLWFLRHWGPRAVVQEYMGHYEQVLKGITKPN